MKGLIAAAIVFAAFVFAPSIWMASGEEDGTSTPGSDTEGTDSCDGGSESGCAGGGCSGGGCAGGGCGGSDGGSDSPDDGCGDDDGGCGGSDGGCGGSDGGSEGSHGAEGTAGGGGWFFAGEEKITFAFHLDNQNLKSCQLVFHGRNKNMTVHAVEFTKVWFKPCKNGGYPSVHAKGEAIVNGTDLYRFHFKATDKGGGNVDAPWLKLWPIKDQGHDSGGCNHDDNATTDDGGCTHDDNATEDDCSCSEDTDTEGIDSCDGGSESGCAGGGCSGGGCSGGGCGGSDGGCGGSDGGCGGGCSGGHDSGHGPIRWIAHGLGGGNIWVTMQPSDDGGCGCGENP